jgi:hypothetical protein
MKAISAKIDNLITAMIGDLSPAGKAWARVGIIVLVVAAAMSFNFGSSISMLHGLFLAGLTFVAAFGPDAAHQAWLDQKKGSAIAIAIICAPLLAIEFYSHAGYTAGLRGHNLAEARVQNMRFDGAKNQVTSEETNLRLLRERLAAKTDERKALLDANPWAPTVKPDGLKAELAVLKDKIEYEIKGGREGRGAGCKKVCESLKDQAANVEKRIGSAEKFSELAVEIDTLNGDIKRLQGAVDIKVATFSKTEHKSSAVAHQNEFLANAVALISNFAGSNDSLKPTEKIAVSSEQSVNLAMALAGTGLPAFALFVAGLYRRNRPEGEGDVFSAPATPAAPLPLPVMPMPSKPMIPLQAPGAMTLNNYTVAGDGDVAKRINDMIEIVKRHAAAKPQQIA